MQPLQPDIKIGKVEIFALTDGWVKFPAHKFFPNISTENWSPYEKIIKLNLGSFLLKSDEAIILVDTGLGHETPSDWEHAEAGLLDISLKSRGFKPEQVDIVAITHLHVDHVGGNVQWNSDIGTPAFHNAVYYIPEDDWNLYGPRSNSRSLGYLRRQITPLLEMGVVRLVKGTTTLTKEVSTWPSPGHTPGHTCFLISSEGETGLVLGDAIHHPSQITTPVWTSRADRDSVTSYKSRVQIIEYLETNSGIALAGHFPEPNIGRISKNTHHRSWEPIPFSYIHDFPT